MYLITFYFYRNQSMEAIEELEACKNTNRKLFLINKIEILVLFGIKIFILS